MDTIDAVPEPPDPALSGRGSQSRLSGTIFFVLLAAVLFRVVSAVMSKAPAEAERRPASLVRWTALEKAAPASAATRKPVLYDFTAEWCVPCRKLDEGGWADAHTAEIVNRSYVPARVLDRTREEGKNPAAIEELQKKYSVEAFPTLVVADPEGREIARLEGYPGHSALERFLVDSSGARP